MDLTQLLNIAALLLGLTFVLSYLNHKFIKLPTTIGLLLISMLMSLLLVIAGELGLVGIERYAEQLILSIDFTETLMIGMLAFLLFAGALHVDINELREKKLEVGIFATVGVIASTFIIGSLMYFILRLVGVEISFIYALLFGALISPTDPIAVLAIVQQAKAPKSLETKITGESLFNDGVGIVLFLTILGIATSGESFSLPEVSLLFAEEAVGGLLLGLIAGYAVYRLLKRINNYQIEIIGTLALVFGVYALAIEAHVSGPIAIVVAGLLIGNRGRSLAMSDDTRRRLDDFWVLVDDILNAVLFVLIGLEVLAITLSPFYVLLGLVAAAVALLARFISVGLPIQALKLLQRTFSEKVVRIMTWGGLRGGISVALALSLPKVPERDLIIAITYVVVAFSILVQGTTIKSLIASDTG